MDFAKSTEEVTYRLITDASEARACFEAMVRALADVADETAQHRASFRPGSITSMTYFFRRYGIWAMPTDGSQLSKAKNRYWNSFGLGGTPYGASNHIAIEINHPHEGKSSVSGRFLKAGNHFYIGHTGRIGGGLKNSDAAAIERITGRPRQIVEIDGRPQPLAFLTSTERSEAFVERLAEFVHGMHDVRRQLTAASITGSRT